MAKLRNDARLTAEMAADGLDAVVCFSMENVLYLSGALFSLQDNIRERLAAAVMTADGADCLICATNETSAIEGDAHVADLRGYVEFAATAVDLLADWLTERGLARGTIGIETRYLMVAPYEALRRRLPEARLVPGDRAVEVARAVKTPDHVALIARASRLTEEAVARAFAATRGGDTERAMAMRLIQEMMAAGADVVRHCVLTAGDNAVHAHPYPSAAKILEPGDPIRVDVGGLFGGTGSDIARMAVVGPPSPEQRRHYGILRACVTETATHLRPGVAAREVYAACVAAYAGHGVDYARDHIGHSLSILGGHDEPMLHGRSGTVLEDGMVIALEPIFRDAAGRRYTVEDTYLVTPQGGKLLTDATDTARMFEIPC